MSDTVKTFQACEFNNLYVDTIENIKRTKDILNICDRFDNAPFAYAYIYHDHDIYTEDNYSDKFELLGHKGDKKKPHYHLYIKYFSQKDIKEFESLFNVSAKDYHIFNPKHYDNKLLYLTHVLHEEKSQYSIDDIKTNIKDYIISLYDKRLNSNDIDIITYILNYIDCEENRTILVRSLISELSKHYTSKDIRSNIYLINTLVNEHNRYSEQLNSLMSNKLKENQFISNKVKTMVDNFGFGRINLDGDSYVVAKDSK